MPDILDKKQLEYLSKFKDSSDELLVELEKFAELNKVPILDWHSAQLLEQLIILKQPVKVLELGTAIAYSSIRIAKYLKNDAKLFTIEKSKPNIKLAADNIRKANLEDKIEMLEGDALDILKGINDTFDFIFLDADKEDYETLYELSLKLLNTSGILFVDNLLWHGYAAQDELPGNFKRSTEFIRRFNNIFLNDKRIKATLIPVGDGIGIGIKL